MLLVLIVNQECNAITAPCICTGSNIGGTIGGVIGVLMGGIAIGAVTMVIMYKTICAPNKDTCRKKKQNKGKRTPATKQ